jgi:hypothetical protein
VGKTVIVYGTSGLVGAFNEVPGITDYTFKIGKTPGPTLDNNIPIQAEQIAKFETYNIVITVN